MLEHVRPKRERLDEPVPAHSMAERKRQALDRKSSHSKISVLNADELLTMFHRLCLPDLVSALKVCHKWRSMECSALWQAVARKRHGDELRTGEVFSMCAKFDVGHKAIVELGERASIPAISAAESLLDDFEFIIDIKVYTDFLPPPGAAWGRAWSDLTAAEYDAATTLGLSDEDRWKTRLLPPDDNFIKGCAKGVAWRKLPCDLRAAAAALGFDEQGWDLDSVPFGTSAKLTLSGPGEALRWEAVLDGEGIPVPLEARNRTKLDIELFAKRRSRNALALLFTDVQVPADILEDWEPPDGDREQKTAIKPQWSPLHRLCYDVSAREADGMLRAIAISNLGLAHHRALYNEAGHFDLSAQHRVEFEDLCQVLECIPYVAC